AASDALNFTVDTTNVVVSINKAVDNVGSKVGDLANNAATDDTTPTLWYPVRLYKHPNPGSTCLHRRSVSQSGSWCRLHLDPSW
ncbi:hypothetical protein ACW7EJ_21380, partial [Acinetobacter soli]